ncbi:MAG TPA: hypothetical protein VEJ20_00025, partial [Candidatus Eremiobacteraceae bacterium]|nr:hypothetical protein [Candidatus Eremiobacteraceae bacterium]
MAESSHPVVACVFGSDARARDGILALRAAAPNAMVRVASADKARAEALAAETGVVADLDPADPLAGAAGLTSGARAASGVNGGAMIGALAGALIGVAASFSALAPDIPVEPSM